MSGAIREYQLKPGYSNHFLLPTTATVMGVQRDGGTMVLWVFWPTNPDEQLRTRHFPIFKTEETVPTGCEYIGTVKVIGDTYHVFERVT